MKTIFGICYLLLHKKVNKSLTASGGLVFEARVDYKVSTESAGLEKSWHKVRLGFVYIADSNKQTADTNKQTADSNKQTADRSKQIADSNKQTADFDFWNIYVDHHLTFRHCKQTGKQDFEI